MITKSPQVQVVGAYIVRVDDTLICDALDAKYPLTHFTEQQRREVRPAVMAEMSSAVLVEVIIENADDRYTADDFSQPDSDQAAYMEMYLSRVGTSVISEYDRPPGDFLRVVFFLHHFDAAKPLKTSYGVVSIPTPTAMPDRLSRIIRYEPVD
jgi:hypothetical protein